MITLFIITIPITVIVCFLLIKASAPYDPHNWVETKDRASGSLVMWYDRKCACGKHQVKYKTPYGGSNWEDV